MRIRSEFLLPELQASQKVDQADVDLKVGSAKCLEAIPTNELNWRILGNTLFFNVRDIARYLVNQDGEVIVEPYFREIKPIIRLFLIGPVLCSLVYAKGLLPLRASSVEINGEATLFVGASGVGKSTLAFTLHKMGHRVLSDDMAAIGLSDGQQPVIYPAYPRIKLWGSTLEELGLDRRKLDRVRPELDKYYQVLSSRSFSPNPVPVSRVVNLNIARRRSQDLVHAAIPNKLQSLSLLRRRFLCRSFLDKGWGSKEKCFTIATKLVNCAHVSVVNRPAEQSTYAMALYISKSLIA